MLGFLSEMQRVHCLLVVGERLSHSANDGSFGVAAEGGLEYARHLTITIVDKCLAVPLRQFIDHIRERQEAPVNIATLSEPKAIRRRLINTFTTRQIDQIKLRHLNLRRQIVLGVGLNVDSEDGMAST